MSGLIDLRQLWANGLATLVRGEISKSGTYTPSWTAATTNPVIGNGYLLGRYVLVGKLCTVFFRLAMGSTTTFGVGVYSFSLPFQAANSNLGYFGHASVYDASTGNRYGYMAVTALSATTLSSFQGVDGGTAAALVQFSPTVPVTFATSDEINFEIMYEIA